MTAQERATQERIARLADYFGDSVRIVVTTQEGEIVGVATCLESLRRLYATADYLETEGNLCR